MSIEAHQTAEIPVESLSDFAQYITGNHVVGSQGGVNTSVVQVTDASTPILQVQDGLANSTIIQVSDSSVAPIVQMADQSQGVFITEGMPGGIQIVDGSMPFVQTADGTSIIQITPDMLSAATGASGFAQTSDGTSIIQITPQMLAGGGGEGLTQVVQFASGQIALIEQQENIDPQQSVQHFVLEQIPTQQATQIEGEIQQQQQQLMDTAMPTHVMKKELNMEITRPPIGKGPFICEICEKSMEKWNQYQRHLRTHEDDKPFRCIHCPASYNIADNLKLHLATHVEPGAKPVCPECGKKFSRIASLKAHIMLHEKEESLMCQECGDEFGLQSQLDRHMIEHKEDEEGTRVYACRQCNAEFSSQKLLKEHTKQHFKIKSSLSHRSYNREIDRSGFSHKCSHCMKSFQKPSQLLRHMRIHTGDRPYKCTMCPKAFNQKGALQIHMLGRHTDKKPHKCQFCDVGFSQKGNLRAHIQRVHTLSEDTADQQVFSCAECTCVFRKLGSLNAHISRFHTEMDPDASRKMRGDGTNEANDVIQQLLELSETGGANTQQQMQQQLDGSDDILQQALQNSGLPGSGEVTSDKPQRGAPEVGGTLSTMNVRDTATGVIKKHYVRKVGSVTWHQCTFCTKEFKKPSDLVRHTRIHSHEKPYKCTQCFRAFAVKSTLNSHVRTHMGIKQFKCSVCDKNFSTHGSLKVHLRLHTGAKPFDCPHCDKKFRTAAHRKSHISGHFKSPNRSQVRSRSEGVKRSQNRDPNLPDVPLQEPILITDTGLIQQPPRSTVFNQYLGESGSVDRPYKCGYCQRGFKKSSHLKQHIRSHTGEKPYKCLQCKRTFVSNGVLKAHIRIHTGMKQYKCVMCDNMFSTNGSLKRHMSTHSDVRPFMCPYCQRTFKTNVNCKKHMKTHRHELAMQSMTEQAQIVEQVPVGDQDEGHMTQEYVEEEETVDNDLTTLSHQELAQSGLAPQTILTQSGLQDALGLDQQILNQQMFGQQQTFTQSLLGAPAQQTYQQVTLNDQNQFSFQQQQQLSQLDLNSFTTQQPTLQDPPSDTPTQVSATQQQVQPGDIVQTEDGVVQQVTVSGGLQQMSVGAGIQQMSVGAGLQQQVIHSGAVQGVHTLTVAGDQVVHSGDELGASTNLQSTNMENILETRTGTEVVEIEEQESAPAQPGQDVMDDGFFGRKYTCEFCSKVYKKSSHLKQHIRSHTGEKPYKCIKCEKTFVSMGVLRQHVRIHTGIKEYKCDVCNALFTTNGSLTRHMNIHVSIKPYKCPYCLEAFRTASICKRHMKSHSEGSGFNGDDDDDEDDGEQEGEAAEAVAEPRRSSRTNKLELVELSTALTKPQNEDLNLSERILIESASERDRVSEVKELAIEAEDKHPHMCRHCPKSFKKPSDLIRHIRIHTGEKPFMCGVCGRMFTVKSTLDSHMKTHGGVEKNIKCHVCSSLFSTKGSLKVHMRLHTGAKPFRCPHCPQRFRTSGHRKSHILSHYKPEYSGRKKRNVRMLNIEEPIAQQSLDFINAVEPQNHQQQLLTQVANQVGQLINIDQSVLQAQNVVPLSVTVDNVGNITETAVAASVLQGLDGVQLQLTGAAGNLGQGIQITGIDPNVFNQTLQIDANLLQQLQSGNVNITLNPNQLQQPGTADLSMLANMGNIQVQPISLSADGITQNMVVQQADMGAGTQVQIQGQMAGAQEVAPTSFVVASDGTISEQHHQLDANQVEMSVEEAQVQQVSLTQPMSSTTLDSLVTTVSGGEMVHHTTSLGQQTLDTAANGIMSVVHGNMVPDDAMQDVTHVSHDMDQETNEMRAIDPNMTNNMADMIAADAQVGESDNDADDLDDDDDDDDDEHMIQETVGDDLNEDLHDDGLMRPQDVSETFQPGQSYAQYDMRAHECNVCNKTFKRSSHLKEHLRIHTKEPIKVKRTALHRCPYCQKSFQKPSQMSRHVRIHTGERPFQCNVCRKSFNQKNALQMHLKKHTGEKPHQCGYCDVSFTQKGNLKTHIKRAHHNEMVQSMNLPKSFDKDADDSHMIHGKYVDEDVVTEAEPEDGQVVNQDLNLVEVADLFNN